MRARADSIVAARSATSRRPPVVSQRIRGTSRVTSTSSRRSVSRAGAISGTSRLRTHRQHPRQAAGDAIPGLSGVAAGEQVAAGRAEVDAGRVAYIGAHRVAQNAGEFRLAVQPARDPLPGFAAIVRAPD